MPNEWKRLHRLIEVISAQRCACGPTLLSGIGGMGNFTMCTIAWEAKRLMCIGSKTSHSKISLSKAIPLGAH